MKSRSSSSRCGIAIVLVLVFLVLLAGLVVALLTTAQTETTSAAIYQADVQLKHLAASATGIVTGQILDATRSTKAADAASGRLAWASQPGLIRTWDDSGGGGRIFKLYSARDMVADADGTGRYSVSDHLAEEIPANWPAQPAHFVDLNEPVLVEDSAGGKILRDGKKLRASYPIIDPAAALPGTSTLPAVLPIDGFALGAVPGFRGGLGENADPTNVPAGSTGNPAAMPVRWIYVLQDGTFTVPTGAIDGGRTATWAGTAPALTPSRENPIVGRVAFWTDDETCKLNVNTASEPTPWDTPRGISIQDLNYGRFQPAQREYQRFPGHPLTTALSPVFFPGVVLTAAQKEAIYKLLPRVQPGGTVAATVAATTPVTLDTDRLYANVDEFLFRPEMPGTTRDENKLVDSQRLRRARFFLTANSRAPELNLFGQPRISLWPVGTNAAQRTGFDRLAAFCSTTGAGAKAKPYFFQRADAASPTADYANIQRNRELYAYLQRLTGSAIPGYGGNFSAKWGQDRDQVLTEIFDYIRCVNLRDPLLVKQGAARFADNGQVAPIQIGNTKGFGRFHTISQAGFHFICAQDGPNGAIDKINPALTAGNRAIEAAFIIEPFSPSLGWYQLQENLFFDVKFLSPFTINGQDLKMQSGGRAMNDSIGNGFHGRRIGGSGGIRGPIASLVEENVGADGKKFYTYAFVGKATPRVKVATAGGQMTFSGGTIEVKVFAGGSADPKRLVQTLTFNFPGGRFPIPTLVTTGTTGYRGANATAAKWWWTFAGYLPPAGAREAGRYSNPRACPHAPGPEYPDPARRFINSGGAPGFKDGGIFRAEDVVRSIVPDHGDIRLIAAQKDVAGARFVKVRANEWEDPAAKFLHIFQAVTGPHHHFGFANEPGPSPAPGIPGAAADDQLWGNAAVPMHYSRLPEIRPGAGKLHNRWGDFDNSIATWADGAYINKPDEGNLSSSQKVGGNAYAYFSWNFTGANENFFSPSRLIPSAGMLGSLPAGVKRNQPWETLLFRPETRNDSTGKPHPGTQSPKDHLLMDLFWMPVIEPYAVSEPFSTAGKVNLNYEIAPFNYIRRATALHGAFKAEEPLVLPNAASKIYKLWDHETNDHPFLPNDKNNQDATVRADWDKAAKGQAPFDRMRRPIDVPKTLAQADSRFAAGEAFRSATEICELHLVREGENLADYQSGKIWQDALITGDNTRERPYTNLYARLTTRSNTFTVHVRVQVLRSAGAKPEDWAVWREDRVQPLGEYRGSSIIERYIDPADPSLPDFALDPATVSDTAYRIRSLSTRKFAP